MEHLWATREHRQRASAPHGDVKAVAAEQTVQLRGKSAPLDVDAPIAAGSGSSRRGGGRSDLGGLWQAPLRGELARYPPLLGLGDRPGLLPRGRRERARRPRSGPGYEPGGWWTCHRDTGEGDLVLLYRSQRRKDLAYLIETRSNAYSLLEDQHAAEQGWDYGCDFEVIEKFRQPLGLAEMRADPALEDWGALRAGFRRRVYAIPADTWNHLLERLSEDRTKSERRRRTAAKRYALERDIEDRLATDLGPFRRHGLTLDLRARQHVCRRGGRADLVCFDRSDKRYVIIELKRGLVSRNAIAQLLSYRSSIAEEFPTRRRPIGVLVGDRLDNEAAGMIADDDRLTFIALNEIM